MLICYSAPDLDVDLGGQVEPQLHFHAGESTYNNATTPYTRWIQVREQAEADTEKHQLLLYM